MSQYQKHIISRRDFLKASGFGLGAIAAALSFRGGSQLDEMTAVLSPTDTVAPTTPSLAPGNTANTIFVNANIVTMDASGSRTEALAVKDGLILYSGK